MQVVTTPEFEALVKKLSKTYRLVDQDIENLIEELEQGARPKDKRLQNMGVAQIYKARLANTSARIGTRGGFRVIYSVKDELILLLLIWAKTQISDLPDREIRRVAGKY